jgi:hypothetical protein
MESKMATFEQKAKKLTREQRRCLRLIDRALKSPANKNVESALQLARVACLGEGMWQKEMRNQLILALATHECQHRLLGQISELVGGPYTLTS